MGGLFGADRAREKVVGVQTVYGSGKLASRAWNCSCDRKQKIDDDEDEWMDGWTDRQIDRLIDMQITA